METPLPNDSSIASISPPVGGRLRSFRRDRQANNCSSNVLNIITNGYVLPFLSKPNLVRFPLIISEYKALHKDQALAVCILSLLLKNAIERVENVKSLGFYSHLFLVPKPHQKWFTPHVDLFATHLNHKLPLYVSPIPDPKAWGIDALNINWTGLTAYAYPPTALPHRVIQKIRQCHCLIIVIAPGWPGMPWFWDLVQLSTEIPL